MKTQTKAVIASVLVIALALTAVSGATYSWWSDSDETTIDITTGGLQAVVDGYIVKETRTTILNGETAVSTIDYTDLNSVTDGIQFTLVPPNGDRTTSTFTVIWSVTFMSTVPAYYKVVFEIDGDDTSWIDNITVKDTNTDITGTLGKWQAVEPGEKTLNIIASFDADIDMASYKDVSITIVNEIIQQAAISKWSGNVAETVNSVSPGTYEIYTGEQLAWVAKQVNDGTNDFSNCVLKLMKDIDLDSKDWTPIGDKDHQFKGSFDGQGHTISNLKVYLPENDYIGLFGHITSATIKDLTIEDASLTGRERIGVAVGQMFNYSTVSGVSVIGSDDIVTITGGHFIGGIVGYTYSDITNCYVENIAIECTPYLVGTVYDNGDKAGCIVGWAGSCDIKDCTVKDSSVKAYRDVGGAIGYITKDGVDPTVDGILLKNVTITVDQSQAGYNGAPKDANAGPIVGRNDDNINLNGSYSGMKIIYDGFVPNEGVKVYPDVDTIIKDVSNDTKGIVVSGDGILTIENVTVNAESGHAMSLSDGCDLVLTVSGTCVLEGAMNGDGISVPAGTSIVITGSGSLTVSGNAGVEYYISGSNSSYCTTDNSAFNGTGGSGIGNAGGSTGSIAINGLTSLSASGYGKNAYGIGGDDATVVISGSTINYARGGFASSDFKIDSSYGSSEAEGGAGIGGSNILIFSTTIDKVDGGSKAAGIGARFHMPTYVELIDSTLGTKNNIITGGNASAGIGGSRQDELPSGSTDYITVKITNSVVNTKGGDFGAGIGSGYDTHCGKGQPVCTIQITKSTITAQGGSRAAGIGTGYHFGALAGYINESAVTASHGDPDFYKGYTIAQDIGYGVVDPTREFEGMTPKFTVDGVVINNPEIKMYTITFDQNTIVLIVNGDIISTGTDIEYKTNILVSAKDKTGYNAKIMVNNVEFQENTIEVTTDQNITVEYTAIQYSISINGESITVTNKETDNDVQSGSSLPYGTKLIIKINDTEIADGQVTLTGLTKMTDDGTYYVVNNNVTITQTT